MTCALNAGIGAGYSSSSVCGSWFVNSKSRPVVVKLEFELALDNDEVARDNLELLDDATVILDDDDVKSLFASFKAVIWKNKLMNHVN